MGGGSAGGEEAAAGGGRTATPFPPPPRPRCRHQGPAFVRVAPALVRSPVIVRALYIIIILCLAIMHIQHAETL